LGGCRTWTRWTALLRGASPPPLLLKVPALNFHCSSTCPLQPFPYAHPLPQISSPAHDVPIHHLSTQSSQLGACSELARQPSRVLLGDEESIEDALEAFDEVLLSTAVSSCTKRKSLEILQSRLFKMSKLLKSTDVSIFDDYDSNSSPPDTDDYPTFIRPVFDAMDACYKVMFELIDGESSPHSKLPLPFALLCILSLCIHLLFWAPLPSPPVHHRRPHHDSRRSSSWRGHQGHGWRRSGRRQHDRSHAAPHTHTR
jgi:hypothetical protein